MWRSIARETWLSDRKGRSPGPAPTGVIVVAGATSAAISGTEVTVNVPLKPADFVYQVTLDFLFS
jgi:hypothetical protein